VNSRDYGFWIIPLLAALAVYYPLTSGKQLPSAAPGAPSSARTADVAASPSPAVASAAERLIRAYSGKNSGPNMLLPGSTVDFFIATVPDPLDSSLSHLFDRHVGAIQRAMEAAGYVLDRFELPWLQKNEQQGQESREQPSITSDSQELRQLRRHELEPGVLLFRHSNEYGKLQVVFLVGETPTAGIRKAAFKDALKQATALCGARQKPETPQKTAGQCEKELGLLAPTFSGSLNSLLNLFRTWEGKPDKLRIVSGSATGIDEKSFTENLKNSSVTVSFKSNLQLDRDTFTAFYKFLKEKQIDRRDVAILTESNTGFGELVRRETEGIQSFTYPLHISQLRSAAEKTRAATRHNAGEIPQTRPENLRLALDDAVKPKDVLTNMSGFETFSTELVLSNLLSPISREGIRYVGIFATDVRDQIFLAREIRKRAPNTVLFTFGADLLYLHSDVNLDFEGMLLFSTYPLFSMNQLWTLPWEGKRYRLQFPNDTSQGVYNATLDLLGKPAIKLEYGLPFKDTSTRPALWLSAVGRNDLWPIKILNDDTAKLEQSNVASAISEAAAIYSRPFVFASVLLTLLCLSASIALVMKAPQKNSSDASLSKRLQRNLDWCLKTCGGAVFPAHQEDRQPFLLCLSIANSIVILVLLSVFSRFVRFSAPPVLVWLIWCSLTALATLLALGATFRVGRQLFSVRQDDLRQFCKNFPILSGALLVLIGGALASAAAFYFRAPGSLPSADFLLDPGVPFLALLLCGLLTILWKTGQGFRLLLPISGGAAAGILAGMSIVSAPSAFLFLLAALLLELLWLFFAGRPQAAPEQAVEGSRLEWLEDRVPRQLGNPLSHFAVGSLPVAVLCVAAAQAFDIWKMDETSRLFYHLRTVNLASGLSPLPPLFFVAAAATLWTICSLRRLRMLEELIGPDRSATPQLLHIDAASAPTLKALEGGTKDLLAGQFLKLRGSMVILFFIGVPCSILFLRRLVPSIEGPFFYLFFGLSFLIVYVALSLTFLRFLCVWWQTRSLLHYLSSSPVAAVFSELTKEGEEMPKMDLSDAFTPHAALWFSLRRANRCPEFSEATDVRRLLEDSVRAEARADWRAAIESRHQALKLLSQAAAVIGQTLDGPVKPAAERVQQAHRFLASQTVLFLHHVLSHLQNLLFFVVSGLILMLLAITYYPFQPREWLLWFNWLVILATVSLTIVVFVQMGRDRVLSLLSNTVPGQVTWNREFLFRVLLYVVVPVLTLLGAQFPESMRQILSWLGAFQSS
jgi:hypothetical protein